MKNKTYDCIVIGGGAAGMTAAITAAREHASVLLLEHTQRLGSKILSTGNGKCNFTNLNMGKEMYQNQDQQFVETVINEFGVTETLDFFQNIGIFHKQKNGYVYPHSETAASLQDALRMEVEHLKVAVRTECKIESVEVKSQSGSTSYQVKTDQGVFCGLTVILCTGSKAAPRTGSDGSGYTIAKHLGHRIRKPLPALVQLTSPDKICKAMAGVRSTGNVQLYLDGSCVSSDLGEIQYTDYGISGIPVFQISRFAVSGVDRKQKAHVMIDMLPDYSEDQLEQDVRRRYTYDGSKTVEQFFSGLLNKKLVQGICKRLGISCNEEVKNMSMKDILHICNNMKEFMLKIDGSKTFDQAQVCQGGVELKEIDPQTMQSRIQAGFFFAGEVVDVDGKCGGYNLQWAWSSAVVAGRSAAGFAKERNIIC